MSDILSHSSDERFGFITQILAADTAAHESVARFRQLLQEDMRALLNEAEIPSPVTTEVLFRLHAVADSMELMASSSAVQDKCVVAVAGGFSSGKSSFITSFMEDAALGLPVGIEPMTSIPTYVITGSSGAIRGYTYKGGVIDIAPHFYGRLSHAFVHSLGFNLRDILPFVAIETPLRDLKHVTFIDLPGYDPASSDSAYTGADRAIAMEFLAQAHALIWVIGLDSNGTVPDSDLSFLAELQLEERPLYVVLNKADLRPEESVVEVLDVVRATLNDSGITYTGLCAYSSTLATQIRHRGQHLKTFLREIDHPTDGRANLQKELNAIFRKLYGAMAKNSRTSAELENVVIALELDLQELGLYRARRIVPIEGRGRRRIRTPMQVAEEAQERLAYLRDHLQSLEVDDAVMTAKKIAEAMRQALKLL